MASINVGAQAARVDMDRMTREFLPSMKEAQAEIARLLA